jgi:Uma2 family endonuclease
MVQATRQRKIIIGPEDDGRRMSLDDFDRAIAREGYLYELGKGVVEVSEVPRLDHGRQVAEVRNQLVVYDVAHPGIIDYLAAGSDAKLLIAPAESERHPDLFVYCHPAPEVDHPWSLWVPEIVIEVVSESSRKRDYEVKPEEYLQLGIDEYWIIGARKKQMTVLQRWRGQWKPQVIRPPKKYRTRFLPGFALDLGRVITAAAPQGKGRKRQVTRSTQ